MNFAYPILDQVAEKPTPSGGTYTYSQVMEVPPPPSQALNIGLSSHMNVFLWRRVVSDIINMQYLTFNLWPFTQVTI